MSKHSSATSSLYQLLVGSCLRLQENQARAMESQLEEKRHRETQELTQARIIQHLFETHREKILSEKTGERQSTTVVETSAEIRRSDDSSTTAVRGMGDIDTDSSEEEEEESDSSEEEEEESDRSDEEEEESDRSSEEEEEEESDSSSEEAGAIKRDWKPVRSVVDESSDSHEFDESSDSEYYDAVDESSDSEYYDAVDESSEFFTVSSVDEECRHATRERG